MSDKVRNALRRFLQKEIPNMSFTGTVVAIDEGTLMCDVQPLDGGPVFYDVRLKSKVIDGDNDNGITIIPVLDSDVIVCVIGNNENNCYVDVFSDIDKYLIKLDSGATVEITNDGKVKLNGDSFGGLIKVEVLKTELEKTNAMLSALISIINGANIPETGSGAPSSLQIALRAAIVAHELGDYSTIENTEVTHGGN